MALDIKLEQKQGMSCDETLLASVARWYNRRYEMLFSKDWNFRLTPPDLQYPGAIARRIMVDKENPYRFVKKYHGIQSTWHPLSRSPKIFKIAARELKAGNPVSVLIDYQYLSFLPEKKRTARFRKFPMIILDIDEVNQGVYCLDIHFLKKVIFLSLDNFREAYSTYTIFKQAGGDKEVDWREVIRRNTKGLIKHDTFNSLRKLAGLIRDSLDYEIEKNLHDINGEPLIGGRIKSIYNSRFLFSHALAYLTETQNAGIPAGFHQQFSKLSTDWFSAWGILAMAMRQRNLNVQRDFESQMQRVSQKIFEIANQEEELCHQFIQVLDGSPRALIVPTESPAAPANPILEFLFVDISTYANNEAFGAGTPSSLSADFTGAGHFFLTEDLPQREIWNTAGMKFKFPVPKDGVNDNITCLGQTIHFQKDKYSALIFLGCSDWGHQSEMLEVYYTDGSQVSLPLEFPNWAYDSSFSREELVWEGKCAEKNSEGAVTLISLHKGHLFGLSIPLDCNKELERIQLPDCRGIHLFAITLGK